MKEHGMIFNAEMVRAILDGRKTQTRRIVKGVPSTHDFHGWVMSSTCAKDEGKACWAIGKSPLLNNPIRLRSPYGEVGDRIWVRETWAEAGASAPDLKLYRANYPEHVPSHYENVPPVDEIRWTPSIHMPRWASRIMLEITGVRVERLNSISNESARAEGYPVDREANGGDIDPWLWFRDLWDGIYPEQSFKHNPWVWVIEFKRVEGDRA